VADDPELQSWVDRLLKGKSEEQARARTEIGLILEARGEIEDAEEIYWTNVQARSTDRRAYDRLMAIYRERGDRLSETLVERQLELAFSQAAAATQADADSASDDDEDDRPSALAPGGTGARPVRRLRRLRRTGRDQDLAAPVDLATRRQAAAVRQTASPEVAAPAPAPAISMLGIPTSAGTGRSASAMPPAAPRQEPVQPAMSMLGIPLTQPAAQTSVPARRPAQAVSMQAVPMPTSSHPRSLTPEVMFDGPANAQRAISRRDDRLAEVQRRRVALAPHGRSSLRSGVLIATQPTTIGAFLLASIGAAALIALLLFGFGRSSVANAAPNPAAGLPARCADANIRFPGANDPRAAVAAAYRQNGVDVDANRPGNPRLTPDSAGQVIGGWIGVSLLLDRAGQPTPTLAQWLSQEPGKPSLANALVSGRSINGLLTVDEWAQVQALPASTCEGAFLRDPRNASLAKLVDGVIIR
jgi:hypothetical protein